MPELRRGPWRLTDLSTVEKVGARVFSIFSCGGGSTMGYKLAGFDVVGCCEIDPEMLEIYRANHRPALPFLMGVKDFNDRLQSTDIPDELRELDILDGSPPCSSFSMAGSRDKDWGAKKKFREGQSNQVLDDLFFNFIDSARLLRPKIVVAENVKGLVMGKARGYVKQIFSGFRAAGYEAQLFLLNAAAMGVPQRRERTVFVARRIDKHFDPLRLVFNEPVISFAEAVSGAAPDARSYKMTGAALSPGMAGHWKNCPPGKRFADLPGNTDKLYSWRKIHPDASAWTMASAGHLVHYCEPRHLNCGEIIRVQSFPDDYNFLNADPTYVCGMSVPPYMMQRVADQVWRQWLEPLRRRPSAAPA